MKNKIYFVFVILGWAFYPACNSQSPHYRFSSDISIKQTGDSLKSLTIGKVYYDLNHKKLVYIFSFPEKKNIVQSDSSMFLFVGDSLVSKQKVGSFAESSVFHFMLTGNMDTYGLPDEVLEAQTVKKMEDMVVTTYVPKGGIEKMLGKILISKKNGELYGVAMYDVEMHLMARQIFRNYVLSGGLNVPTEIIQYSYPAGMEIVRIMSFKNVIINESGNDEWYDFHLPE